MQTREVRPQHCLINRRHHYSFLSCALMSLRVKMSPHVCPRIGTESTTAHTDRAAGNRHQNRDYRRSCTIRPLRQEPVPGVPRA